MQLLFETSEEGEGAGLAALRGRSRRLRARRAPHVGWNEMAVSTPDALVEQLPGMLGYYAHSYVVEPVDAGAVVAWTCHEQERFPAIVRRDRTWGVQFRPEKSGAAGLQLIRNFLAAAA